MITISAATSPETASESPLFAGMLIVAGIVLIALLLSVSMRNRIARRQADRPSAREQIASVKAAASRQGVRRRAEEDSEIAGPSFDAARQLAAMLDNKAARLEQLLEEADETIRRLESTVNDARPGERATTIAPPDRPERAERPGLSSLDPFTRSVYDMADEGRSPIEIARHLDEQIGKIELILALRRT